MSGFGWRRSGRLRSSALIQTRSRSPRLQRRGRRLHFRSTARAEAVAANTAGIGNLPPERRDLWNFVIWPNFMANIYPGVGNISTNRLVPLAADRTLALYEFYPPLAHNRSFKRR